MVKDVWFHKVRSRLYPWWTPWELLRCPKVTLLKGLMSPDPPCCPSWTFLDNHLYVLPQKSIHNPLLKKIYIYIVQSFKHDGSIFAESLLCNKSKAFLVLLPVAFVSSPIFKLFPYSINQHHNRAANDAALSLYRIRTIQRWHKTAKGIAWLEVLAFGRNSFTDPYPPIVFILPLVAATFLHHDQICHPN